MSDDMIKLQSEELKREFNDDTAVIAKQTERFVRTIQPSHLIDSKDAIMALAYDNSDVLLDTFTFYRIKSCDTENKETQFEYLNNKMVKLYTALYSLNTPFVYGVISYQGVTNLVIGFYSESKENESLISQLTEGLLDKVDIVPFKPDLCKRPKSAKNVGLISAVPTVQLNDKPQTFSLASMMRSLNGQNYTVLFIAKPLTQDMINKRYGEIIDIRDKCFAVSKRNISRQQGLSHSVGETEGHSETNTTSTSTTVSKTHGGSSGINFIVGVNRSYSKTRSKTTTNSFSETNSYSKTITDAVNQNEGISNEVQNGFALELMAYADYALERLKQGRTGGMWETVISFSADTELAAGVIQTCISGELAKPNPDLLPQSVHTFELTSQEAENNSLIIPREIISSYYESSGLCTAVTSEELGLMCTFPTDSVPDFEIKTEIAFPLVSNRANGIFIGNVCNGQRVLENMPFTLSHSDLVKHTFVCGITGSGKTTTVKNILRNANVPFLVLESAKKEYRNIALPDGKHPMVYTLGKPEINCLRMNPFYIPCGVSPQMHIDYLKDLFNASFSFYGPMPYILEKCLQNIYKKKGWNLTLGFHPYLVNISNPVDFFDSDYMREKYSTVSHRYLFPTMSDLKKEIEYYVEHEMNYDGEVSGNIKTAIKARLESLCTGSKGYMFNTYEYADMSKLLENNVVFELEGLSDDADKAFCVGLLIIYINEYRQVAKETTSSNSELTHLLVIEEAHRLLKNISTERISEDIGNPKGKAVEHFTNMIAEMRSYGQGVIVAEQIPSKLAPDVIKNSSNKIIQRLVAIDDQEIVSCTIGLSKSDGLRLGSLTTGTALCHKEGMNLPVLIKIPSQKENTVNDGMLYHENITDRFYNINCQVAREVITDNITLLALQILNTIMVQDFDDYNYAIKQYRKTCTSLMNSSGSDFVMCDNDNAVFAELLTEAVIKYMMNGVYSIRSLISDQLKTSVYMLILYPDQNKLLKTKKLLKKAYNDDPSYKAKQFISMLIKSSATDKTDICGTIRNYFVHVSDNVVSEITKMIVGRC